jgi:hypothetical protein
MNVLPRAGSPTVTKASFGTRAGLFESVAMGGSLA